MVKKKLSYCGAPDHDVSRRVFLGGLAASGAVLAGGATGDLSMVHALTSPALTREVARNDRRVILLWLAGGASQLETWDPKPGRPTGGPFASIPTSVPGTHISELMPQMAERMQHTCVIRSLNTGDAGHVPASKLMMRGRRDEPSLKYPDLGAMVAHELARAESAVPDYVSLFTATEGRSFAQISPRFLGARYAPIRLAKEQVPPNLRRLDAVSAAEHRDRARLRELLSTRFAKGRDTLTVNSHANAYARVTGLMSSEDLFDISKEPESVRERYGPTLFGQQTIMARRMAEAGVPFVRVARAWWDSHGQNFETHQEMVPELDRVLSALIDDLKARGLFESTLVITMAEFGRTPKINPSLGRDHFARAWSATLHGCGVQNGAVWGKTDADGQHVVEGEAGAGQFIATIFQSLGIDPSKEYHVGSRPVPLVNPGIEPIRAVLA